MPITEEGTRRLFGFFMYGTLRAAETLGNPSVFIRTVVQEGLRSFLVTTLRDFEASESAAETCDVFHQAVDRAGFLNASDTIVRGDGDNLSIEIGERCPYRTMCKARHDEGRPVHCIRAYILAEMLRIRMDADFDWKLTRFGRPCQITMARSPWGKS